MTFSSLHCLAKPWNTVCPLEKKGIKRLHSNQEPSVSFSVLIYSYFCIVTTMSCETFDTDPHHKLEKPRIPSTYSKVLMD